MSRSDNFLLRRYIERAMVDLPAMPTTVLRAVKAIEEGQSALQIERIILADPAITSKVLKTVNSPYFGMSRTVTSVSHAITVLGMSQLRNVVLSIGVLNALSTTSPRIQELQRRCWSESFASAASACRIAQMKGLGKGAQDTILIGGLLHDIGQLFLLTLFNVPYSEVKTRSLKTNKPMFEVERAVLGTTHAELGASLAERWSFPPELVDMIRLHEGGTSEALSPSVSCVHLADRLINRLESEGDVEARFPFDPSAVAWLGGEAALAPVTELVKADLDAATKHIAHLAA